MKMRIVMLLMSLFALTPALLGSAWGIENRAKKPDAQECAKKGPKDLDANSISGIVKQHKAGKIQVN